MNIHVVGDPAEKLELIPHLIADAITGIPPQLQAEALITLGVMLLGQYFYHPGVDPIMRTILEPMLTELGKVVVQHGGFAPSFPKDRNVAQDDNDDTQAFNN